MGSAEEVPPACPCPCPYPRTPSATAQNTCLVLDQLFKSVPLLRDTFATSMFVGQTALGTSSNTMSMSQKVPPWIQRLCVVAQMNARPLCLAHPRMSSVAHCACISFRERRGVCVCV